MYQQLTTKNYNVLQIGLKVNYTTPHARFTTLTLRYSHTGQFSAHQNNLAATVTRIFTPPARRCLRFVPYARGRGEIRDALAGLLRGNHCC